MIEGYKKWLAGGLGLLFGGPAGAVLGFLLGTVLDSVDLNFFYDQIKSGELEPESLNFKVSLLILAAADIKADGDVAKSQLDYVQKFLVQQFGLEQANASMNIFNQLDKNNISIEKIAVRLSRYFDYSTRLELVYFLFGVANADGKIVQSELEKLARIATFLDISPNDFRVIQSMFIKKGSTVEMAYQILGVEVNADNNEIKAAYRKLTLKFHPDRVSKHGADVEKSAKEKYQKIVDAWELIKENRGIK